MPNMSKSRTGITKHRIMITLGARSSNVWPRVGRDPWTLDHGSPTRWRWKQWATFIHLCEKFLHFKDLKRKTVQTQPNSHINIAKTFV